MDVGAELRRAREQRGLSLQALAERTKISPAVLRALESNDRDRLPGGVFTRGFLKAYALEVGLDPAGVVQRYTSQFEPPAPPSENIESRRDSVPATHRLPGRARAFVVLAALMVVAAFAFYVAFARWHGTTPPRSSDKLPASPTVHAVDDQTHPSRGTVAAAVATESSPPAGASPAAMSATPLRVELQPSGQCWIAATADGRRVAYRLMQPGDRLTIEASGELVLRIGEPANLRLSVNGSPAKPFARSGTPITVRITPENYREFLVQ